MRSVNRRKVALLCFGLVGEKSKVRVGWTSAGRDRGR